MGNDPVNWVDPSGLYTNPALVGAGVPLAMCEDSSFHNYSVKETDEMFEKAAMLAGGAGFLRHVVINGVKNLGALVKYCKAKIPEINQSAGRGIKVAKKELQKLKCITIKKLKNKFCNSVGLRKTGGKNTASLKTMKNYIARKNFDNITCLSVILAYYATKLCIYYRRVATVLVRQKKCIGSKKPNARKEHKIKIKEQKDRLDALKAIKEEKGC